MEKLKVEAKAFYESTLREAKKQIEIIDAKIEEELARVKDVIAQLQEQKKATRLIYDGACQHPGRQERIRGRRRPGRTTKRFSLLSGPCAMPRHFPT